MPTGAVLLLVAKTPSDGPVETGWLSPLLAAFRYVLPVYRRRHISPLTADASTAWRWLRRVLYEGRRQD